MRQDDEHHEVVRMCPIRHLCLAVVGDDEKNETGHTPFEITK